MPQRARTNSTFFALLIGALAAAGLFAWLADAVWRGQAPIALDARLAGWVGHLPVGPGQLVSGTPLELIAGLGSIVPAAVGYVALVWWATRTADGRLVKVAVLGPALAMAGATVIAKPIIGRQLGAGFAFPSGHVTVVLSLALTALVLLAARPLPAAVVGDAPASLVEGGGSVEGSGSVERSGSVDGSGSVEGGRPVEIFQPAAGARHRRRVAVAMAAVATIAVTSIESVAVVALDRHTPTDAIGAVLLTVAVIGVVASMCLRWTPAERPLVAAATPRRLAFVIIGAALGLAGAVRLPFLVLSPGSLIPLNSAVSVGDPSVSEQAGPLHGTYSGLTVRSTQLTFAGWVWHEAVDSPDPILSRDALIPKGESGKEYRTKQLQVFVSASQVAVAVAEHALGEDVEVSGDGALITAVLEGGPVAGLLEPGDVVVGVNDSTVSTESVLRDALAAASASAGATDTAPIDASIELRGGDGTTRAVAVALQRLASTGRYGLGVGVTTSNLQFDLPTDVSVNGGDVGGPSAGLLTALAVYDTLSADDIAAGRHVTGTGTLDFDGKVGTIGGIEEKVRAAIAAHADLFYAPAEQADAARKAADGKIDVIAVHTFDEALTALRTA